MAALQNEYTAATQKLHEQMAALRSERDTLRRATDESLVTHRQERDALSQRLEAATAQAAESARRVEALQGEVARLVRERQHLAAAHSADGASEEAAELRHQRDRLREAVRSLQHSSSVSSMNGGGSESTVLREQVGVLQAQLAAERSANDALRRRIQRERLGARLDALDSVGEQIHDLKRVLGGDWSTIASTSKVMLNRSDARDVASANSSRVAVDRERFATPSTIGHNGHRDAAAAGNHHLKTHNNLTSAAAANRSSDGHRHAPPAAAAAPMVQQQQQSPQGPRVARDGEMGRIVEEIASDRKRLEDLRAKLAKK